MLKKDILSLIISGVSLAISAFVAYRNIWLSRAKIKVIQTDNASRSFYMQSFDGNSPIYSGEFEHREFPYMKSALLIELIITNKSSLPISVLEFYTKDFTSNAFTSYSETKDSFVVTTSESSSVRIGNDYPIKYLQPEFTIQPYTSERGYILFWSGLEDETFVTPKKITLGIKTSRKSFKFPIKIPASFKSINKTVRYSKDENGIITEEFIRDYNE